MPPVPPLRDASSGDWNTDSCQTLETQAAHTRCQCQHLSTFAVLAQPPKDLVSGTEAWAAQGIRVTPKCGSVQMYLCLHMGRGAAVVHSHDTCLGVCVSR